MPTYENSNLCKNKKQTLSTSRKSKVHIGAEGIEPSPYCTRIEQSLQRCTASLRKTPLEVERTKWVCYHYTTLPISVFVQEIFLVGLMKVSGSE